MCIRHRIITDWCKLAGFRTTLTGWWLATHLWLLFLHTGRCQSCVLRDLLVPSVAERTRSECRGRPSVTRSSGLVLWDCGLAELLQPRVGKPEGFVYDVYGRTCGGGDLAEIMHVKMLPD